MHVDQLPRTTDDGHPNPGDDSAAIVVVASSVGGCRLDAVLVDWSENGPGRAGEPGSHVGSRAALCLRC